MKNNVSFKIISFLIVIATLITTLPLTVFAEEIKTEESADAVEIYIKAVKLAEAKTGEEAKAVLEEEGYIFVEGNLNAGTGEDGVWLGYQTTTNPSEAIYDMKLMNTKGGFTITSMKEALASQESAFAEMASDFEYLVEEFIDAYEEESVPAQKAYKALNFFRVVNGETELAEENGLGYQIISGNMSTERITEILMFCDPTIVDTIVKLLTMGIQLRNGNWLEELSEAGPYDSETVYGENEAELLRRAEQLLTVIEIYAGAYAAMDKSGLIPDELDENFEAKYDGAVEAGKLTAEEAALKKADEGRYRYYKIAFDELAKYSYGTEGKTLKDFFLSFAEGGSEKALYPLVSVLSDGEFSALSYGCFLEVVSGVSATAEGFDTYDATYEEITKDVSSVYLYTGVDSVLLEDDTLIGFTDTATRHMATTGEMEFYENEKTSEYVWTTGKHVTMVLGSIGLAFIALPKLAIGVTMIAGAISATVAGSIKSGVLAGMVKFCSVISGGIAFLVVVIAVAVTALASLIWSLVEKDDEDDVDWEKYPMPEYLYDVKEVTFSQSSSGGIVTESMRRPIFALYEAVTDTDGRIVDLNVRSDDASQWIAMYASYDRQGDDAKPIKADGFLVRYGNGETPDGYTPLARFGEVVACDLNGWDDEDEVNGVYVFYKQDKAAAVESDKKYYISDVFLQSGESPDHCIELLENAGYTPLNVNLSPDYSDAGIVNEEKTSTYIGYKVTTNPEYAIRDLRMFPKDSTAEIRYGAATYAQCGSNGRVSLYATKYKSSGSPILAGGIICVNNRADAPLGYEPVNQFSGGPAISFNLDLYQRQSYDDTPYYLYFLPEETFTEGDLYLSGVGFSDGQSGEYRSQHAFQQMGYEYAVPGIYELRDGVVYSGTYNPYRAVYKLKATSLEGYLENISFESLGYHAWANFGWTYVVAYADSTSISYNNQWMGGTLYIAGNPSGTNLFVEEIIETPVEKEEGRADTETEEEEVIIEIKRGMSEVQPIKLADFICTYKGSELEKSIKNNQSSTFKPLTDAFGNGGEAAVVRCNEGEENIRWRKDFVFYVNTDTEDRPYVSEILVFDKLSVIRSFGEDADVWFDDVSDTILLSQLANSGATNYVSYTPVLRQTDVWDSDVLDSYDDLNAYKFAYKKTATKKAALRDVVIYFNGFSTDEPPKSICKNGYEYKLLSEISFNFMLHEDAPKPSAYIYGTTETKAGNPIIDFDVSASPFKSGYETVRTVNGRSLYAEIGEYTDGEKSSHPFEWAREMFDIIYHYFDNDDGKEENSYFYLHIKREGDDVRKQKPYIGEVLATYGEKSKAAIVDKLFDMGAEGFVDFDLNEDAGGKKIYIGYTYTADPADAIKDVRFYHKRNPPKTLTDGSGKVFTLASDLDLNKGAGGDYVYIYTTKDSQDADPIIGLETRAYYGGSFSRQIWYDGSTVYVDGSPSRKWNSSSYSDLNGGTRDDAIYFWYSTVSSRFVGTYKAPKVAKDDTYTRDAFKKDANGKYVGGIYVMDKLTVLKEKIAAGKLAPGSSCRSVSDQDVFDRLTAMGATTIVKTPISVDDSSYFSGNSNKAFIGYSKTNDKSKAIKNLVIKAEVLSLGDPKEKITVGGRVYNLVAEAAKKVTKLPEAINLLAVEGYEDKLLPRLYLYYSTSGESPIYDISIDENPLVNGWKTAVSGNELDPFADLYKQAYDMYEIADQEDSDRYDSEIVYTDALFEFMYEVSELFDPEEPKLTPFYVHYKGYAEERIEDVKPYIGKIFIAEAESRAAALSKLVAFAPDGFVDVDLNQDGGGNKIYMAYSRVEKAKDAITDIAVYEGSKFEPSRRISINGKSVKYDLVSDIDLNLNAGGKYLYLYASTSSSTGGPVTRLDVKENIDSYLKCGVERVTVRLAEGKTFTDEFIDLNKGAGGDYLYMIMTRSTDAGHRSNGVVSMTIFNAPTCVDDGSRIKVTACADCGMRMETVSEVFKADGVHTDSDDDGDHDCDVCDAIDVSGHLVGGVVEKDPDNPGKYKFVCRCPDCGEPTGEEYPVIDSYNNLGIGAASLFGGGSVIAICSLAGIAIIAAIAIYIQKKKKIKNDNGDE